MILRFDTVVTDTTMVGPWWTPDVAAFAVLGGNLHGSISASGRHDHGPLSRSRTEVERVIIRITRWKWVQIAG